MAQQLEQEMYMIDLIFTCLEVLQIMIDIVTFIDLFNDDNAFDSGTFAGKGLVNAGFTTYYLIVNAMEEDEGEVVIEEEEAL